jgi:hypothetical protein
MKVKSIIPCVCADHEATAADSVFYGMPRLYVSVGQRYSAYCPKCGRGGSMGEHKSAYLALKDWNKIQADLRTPVLFGGEHNG